MAKNDQFLTFEEAYRMLTYDCFTGEIRWSDNLSDLTNMPQNVAVRLRGEVAGTVAERGYIQISIKGRRYRAHRLAWLMTFERWPDADIDHEDGNTSNNRIKNLIDATKTQNARNQRIGKNSTTGVNGVTFNKTKKRYIARIDSNGKTEFLGQFNTIEEAAAARQAANEKYGFHPLHGTSKEKSDAQR